MFICTVNTWDRCECVLDLCGLRIDFSDSTKTKTNRDRFLISRVSRENDDQWKNFHEIFFTLLLASASARYRKPSALIRLYSRFNVTSVYTIDDRFHEQSNIYLTVFSRNRSAKYCAPIAVILLDERFKCVNVYIEDKNWNGFDMILLCSLLTLQLSVELLDRWENYIQHASCSMSIFFHDKTDIVEWNE